MDMPDFISFLQSTVPSYAEVVQGQDDMVKIDDRTTDAQAYIRYDEGLDFSLQGVRFGEKEPVRNFSFKNEQEMLSVLSPLVLECLDGERRI